MKIFQVWVNIGIDDRHSICSYIMPLTTSSSGTHGTSREYSLDAWSRLIIMIFYGFVKIRITRAKKAKIEEEHYHEQSRNKK